MFIDGYFWCSQIGAGRTAMSRITFIPASFIMSITWSNHAKANLPSEGSSLSQARWPIRSDRRRPHGDVEDHLYPGLVHHVHHLVEPCESKPPVGGLVAVPSKVPHPHDSESCGFHECYVMPPCFRVRVMGMIICTNVKLLG